MKKGFTLLAAVALLASCQKDNHASLREELISRGPWSIRTFSATNTAFDDSLITISVSDSLVGNEIRFASGGDFIRRLKFRLGGYNIDSMATTGRWMFKAADTRLMITDTSLAGEYDVNRLDDSLLVISKTTPNENDTSHITVTTTFHRR